MPELIDTTCRKCWGRGSVRPETIYPAQTCDRCKGTGEEPDHFSWLVVIVCLVILVVGLYAIWSIK